MQLLQDIVDRRNAFKAVLVYDVSRWGRFQDTDESAYYEFLRKSAGVPVHYCAEPFKNNTSSPAVVMKNLKRVMAAEYSRELSERLTRTKKILTEGGFRVGGAAGYGLRRMLLSPRGVSKAIAGSRRS
jgi:DNA invertase Pin-like site-specific DNA recombinase